MKLKVLAFGISQDILKSRSVVLSVPENSISLADLKTFLVNLYPGLSKLASFMIAVNGGYTYDENKIVKADDELAIIPPTSGG